MWRKGDILQGCKRGKEEANHFIIFWEEEDEVIFLGAVLTHSKNFENNVPMTASHFEVLDANGGLWPFQFDDSLLVRGKFIKLNDWGPFYKVGRLTKLGIDFVSINIEDSSALLWSDFLKKSFKKRN